MLTLLLVAIVLVALLAVLVARGRLASGSFWPWLSSPNQSHDYLNSVRQIEDEVRKAGRGERPRDPAP